MFGEGELAAQVEGRGDYGLRVLRFSSRERFSRSARSPRPHSVAALHQARGRAADRERYQTVFARAESRWPRPRRDLHFTPPNSRPPSRASGSKLRKSPWMWASAHSSRSAPNVSRITRSTPRATKFPRPRPRRSRRRATRKPPGAGDRNHGGARSGRCGSEKNEGEVTPGQGGGEIFLYPGKRFQRRRPTAHEFPFAADRVCWRWWRRSPGRENVLRAYRHAVEAQYRFYSYGDCMLIR